MQCRNWVLIRLSCPLLSLWTFCEEQRLEMRHGICTDLRQLWLSVLVSVCAVLQGLVLRLLFIVFSIFSYSALH